VTSCYLRIEVNSVLHVSFWTNVYTLLEVLAMQAGRQHTHQMKVTASMGPVLISLMEHKF